jgi:hypothetical protein
MRKLLKQRISFCSLGLSFFLLFPCVLHAQDNRSGTIKNVTGSVSLLRSGATLVAEPGAAVVERDRISTGPNSGAAFSLRDGTTISLGPNSIVDMTSFRFESTKQEGELTLGLVTGALRFISGLLSKRSSANMHISTNTATIGIRGTDFIVEAE